MATETPNLTKTERNLWNAIVGEAMAYLKYNAFAHKALEEGYPEVAQVFQEVAGAETIHGMNHLRVAGEIKSTIDNLRNVTEGETKEFSFMYPRMIRDAQDENRQDAVSSFTLALEREKHHLEVFTRALEQLEALQRTVDESTNHIQQYNEKISDQATAIKNDSAPTEVPTPTSETYISATREVDRERFRVANLGRLREVVFGAQDGILSTVALVTAVAVGVGASGTSTVLVAGLAAALAGMISMATGAYLGSRAEQGSSINIMSGSIAMVLAMHKRCCCPPDKLFPFSFNLSFTSSHKAAWVRDFSTNSSMSPKKPFTFAPQAMLS